MTTGTRPVGGGTIRSYRELIVWRKAMALARIVYRTTADLPASERFGICSQLRRAAVSVPSNIAEGQGRMTNGDFVRFLAIARGSLLETETLLLLCVDLEFLAPGSTSDAMSLADEVSRMLAVMIRKLGRRRGPN